MNIYLLIFLAGLAIAIAAVFFDSDETLRSKITMSGAILAAGLIIYGFFMSIASLFS